MQSLPLDDIATSIDTGLKNHVHAYLGKLLPDVFANNLTVTDGAVNHSVYNDAIFLNTNCTIETYAIKSGENLFFCIIAQNTNQEFASYFPQMIPDDPWECMDVATLPFPNLAALKVENAKWLYLYFSSNDDGVKDTLWASFCQQFNAGNAFPFDGTINDKATLSELRQINKNEVLPNNNKGWNGGLFYFGSFLTLPFPQLANPAVTALWKMVTGGINVQGCVYYNDVLANLCLQVPVISFNDPFGSGGVVKSISFTLEAISPLIAVDQDWPSLLEDNDTTDDNTIQLSSIKQQRVIGLIGSIVFSNNNSFTIEGLWPLDDDTIEINMDCKLSDLGDYFRSSAITGLENILPKDVAINASFGISKENKSLEKIAFGITAANWNLIDGLFSLESINFQFKVFQPTTVKVITAAFSAKATLGKNINLICNGNYPTGDFYLGLDPTTPIYIADVINVFSSAENSFSKGLAITEFSGGYNSISKYVAFKLTIADNTAWKIGDVGLKLNNISFGIYGAKKYHFKLQASFSYTFSTGSKQNLLFYGGAEYNEGWLFNANYKGDVSLKEIGTEFGISKIPDELDAFSFKELQLAIDTSDNTKYFHGNCSINIFDGTFDVDLLVNKTADTTDFTGSFTTKIEGNDVDFNINFAKDGDGYQLKLRLLFTVASVTIYLDAAVDSGNAKDKEPVSEKHFSGGTKGLNVKVKSLLTDLLKTVLPTYEKIVPLDFLPEIDLNDIYVSYNGKTKETNFIALTTVAGNEVKLFFQYKAGDEKLIKSSYAFGINGDFGGLGSLPMVGDTMKDIKFEGIGFVYTSAEGKFNLPELSPPTDAVRKIVVSDKAKSFGKGFNIVGQLNMPNMDVFPLTLPLASSTSTPIPDNNNTKVATTTVTALPASIQPGVTWINLEKKIGPLSVNKIGFAFADSGVLSLLINGSLTLAGLTLTVEGLGLSFIVSKLIAGKLSELDAQFKLSGLGLSFEKSPLKLSGIFLRAEPTELEILSFYGAAQISTSSFSISGIGAYSQLKAGGVSFFIYAAFNGPIGGPSFFFVTGIAAGFGYNRKIRVPKLEEVNQFPLVAMVLNADPSKTADSVLTDLVKDNWTPASPGDYWMAIGIKFTSFKIIESFVLLTVQFGTRLEFNLLGLSLLKWPNEGTAIVYIELAVKATFGPDSDVISVTAMLSPNSYILDKNCKISGGFAFYTWISGAHEGDFVITLGGYHPIFKVPAHYPMVDRLALNWKFSDVLAISGEMYYALTPQAIMAGGRWEVAYDLSFLSASLTIWADMIISWAPFYYQIKAGIIIRIEANINIGFININFKIQMGCEVRIWGPPFAGEIYVDWTIFSFTIPFGSAEKHSLKPLAWSNVKANFKANANVNANANSNTDTNNDEQGFIESFVPKKEGVLHPLDTRFIGGVMDEYKDKKDGTLLNTFINPYNLVLGVDSFFPITTIYSDEAGEKQLPNTTLMELAGADNPQWLTARNTAFGIKPMGISNANVQLNVWLEINMNGKSEPVEGKSNFLTFAKGVAGALWANSNQDAAVIKNVLSGLQLHTLEDISGVAVIPIKINATFYKSINLPAPDTRYLTNIDAGSQLDADKIRTELADNMKKVDVKAALTYLADLGFQLYEPDHLLLEDLAITPPLFIAALGQKIPSKISS